MEKIQDEPVKRDFLGGKSRQVSEMRLPWGYLGLTDKTRLLIRKLRPVGKT